MNMFTGYGNVKQEPRQYVDYNQPSNSSISMKEKNNSRANKSNGEDESEMYSYPDVRSRISHLSWYSSMSLLELAYKLKQAKNRVFGKCSPKIQQDEEQMMETEENSDAEAMDQLPVASDSASMHVFSNLLESKFVEDRKLTENDPLALVREQYRKFEASFPRTFEKDVSHFDGADDDSDRGSFLTTTGGSLENRDQLGFVDTGFSKRHRCDWCSYHTDSKSHLIRHQRAMHREASDSNLKVDSPLMPFGRKLGRPDKIDDKLKKHKCDLCSYQTDCRSHLRRHQGSVHSKDKPYQCPVCKKEFARSEKVKEHHMTFHSDIPYDPKSTRKVYPASEEFGKLAVDKFTRIKMLFKDADIDLKKEVPEGSMDSVTTPKDDEASNDSSKVKDVSYADASQISFGSEVIDSPSKNVVKLVGVKQKKVIHASSVITQVETFGI